MRSADSKRGSRLHSNSPNSNSVTWEKHRATTPAHGKGNHRGPRLRSRGRRWPDHPRQDAFHYLLHDRDSIFSEGLDRSITALGLWVLKSPPRSPKANAVCERLIGTIRRECLDWLIPISEDHLRAAVRSWAMHYNRGRPHMCLGPGIPDPPENRIPSTNAARRRHQLGSSARLARQIDTRWPPP